MARASTVVAAAAAALAIVLAAPDDAAAAPGAAARQPPVTVALSGLPRGPVTGRTRLGASVSSRAAIRRVEFWIDGRRVWTERRRPYRFKGDRGRWVPSLDASTHTVHVRAYDARGRRGGMTRKVAVARGAAPPAPSPTSARAAEPSSAAPAAPAGTGGGSGSSPTAPPPPPPVPPSWFVAPNGSDSGPGTSAAPFKTFDRAYRAASPGQAVEVSGGTYPKQILRVDPAKTSDTDVVFRPAPSADVRLDYLEVYGRQVEFQALRTDGFYIRPGGHGVTLRGVVSSDAGFVTSSDNVSIVGGQISGVDSFDGLQVKAATGGPEPRNLVIDGLTIRDITRTSDPTSHVECIQFTAVVGLAIRNSRFVNCSTQGVFLKEGLGGQIRDVTVENNWFGKISGFYTLIIGDGVSDVTIRNNSFAQSPRLASDGNSGVRVIGNAGTVDDCPSGVTFSHNVWTKAKCGATDLAADPRFVNANAFDLRLRNDSPAIDRANPADHPPNDIFGAGRPLGGGPDAGAHEAR